MPKPISRNILFYGDNLPILREYIPDESVDFITLEKPAKDMTIEAVSAGFYHSNLWQKDYPRVQILTIKDLHNGKNIELPSYSSGQTFKQAEKVKKSQGKHGNLGI